MEKKKIAFIAIIVSLFLVVTGTVVGVIATLSDSTDETNHEILEKNVTLENALTHQAVSALENTSESGKVELRLTEYDMNEILYAVSRNINISGVEIKSIYVKFYEDEYKIFVPVKIMGINSLVSGNLRLYELDSVIHAEVHDLKIGHLSSSAIVTVLGGFEGEIVSALAELHITASIGDDTVYAEISRENLGEMIYDLTEESPSQGLILAVYNLLMLNTDAVTLNLGTPSDCSVIIDLSCFGGFESDQFVTFNPTVSGYISSGAANTENINLVSKYYVNGYDRLLDDEKSQILSAFSSIIYADEIEAHAGLIIRAGTLESLFNAVVRDPFENIFDNLFSGSLLNISGDSVSDILSSLDVVGLTIPLVSYRDNSCTYIIIQSMEAKIEDDSLGISVCVNANGFVLPISVRLDVFESPITDIKGTLADVSIGGIPLSVEDVALVHDFLRSSLEIKGIVFSEGDRGVSINVMELVPVDLGFLGSSPSKFIIGCESGSSNGRLKITLKIK